MVHSKYDGFLCTRATKEGKNVKPTVLSYFPPKVIVQNQRNADWWSEIKTPKHDTSLLAKTMDKATDLDDKAAGQLATLTHTKLLWQHWKATLSGALLTMH